MKGERPTDNASESIVGSFSTALDVEQISAIVVDAAFHIHAELGPGLLESVDEAVLARVLSRRGLVVERQKLVTFEFDGIRFE